MGPAASFCRGQKRSTLFSWSHPVVEAWHLKQVRHNEWCPPSLTAVACRRSLSYGIYPWYALLDGRPASSWSIGMISVWPDHNQSFSQHPFRVTQADPNGRLCLSMHCAQVKHALQCALFSRTVTCSCSIEHMLVCRCEQEA